MTEGTDTAARPAVLPVKIGALTLFVEDLAEVREFYQRALGAQTAFEDETSWAFAVGGVFVNVVDVKTAPELIEPAPVGGPDRGARALVTLAVADVDGTCAELVARGVRLLNGPMDRPWGVRTAAFADPAGHVWEIADLG